MASAANGQPLRILVVEDEALLAMDMEGILTAAGYEVVALADDLASAVARADETRPDLALLDIQLRGSSGLDVAAELGKRKIACLFVTGNCPRENARELGLGCLHKPFDERLLLGAVSAADAMRQGRTPPVLPHGMHIY